MEAVAIGAGRISSYASAVLSFSAQPFLLKDIHRPGVLMGLMARHAHRLYFGAPIKNVGAGHHGFIVHMCRRFSMAVGACDTLAQMVGGYGVIVKVQMAHQAQAVVVRQIPRTIRRNRGRRRHC